MKQIDVYGLGNAILDIQMPIPADVLSGLNFSPGSSELVDSFRQAQLLQDVSSYQANSKVSAGGSVANSVITVAELGGQSAFASRIANDAHGLQYKDEFDRLRVQFGNPLIVGGTTGTSVVLITPDGERTMRTHLGVAREISEKDFLQAVLKQSKWLFVEGYLFANGPDAQDAIYKAIALAKAPHERDRAGVAITLSDKGLAKAFRSEIDRALCDADLLFANKKEALAFTGAKDLDEAIKALKSAVPNLVVTAGADGAFISAFGQEAHVPTMKCLPLDTTGAGDAFAGGFLYGITNGFSATDAAKGGNFLASKVIMQYGARLHTGVREAWDEALS